jgi:hypothetical protein
MSHDEPDGWVTEEQAIFYLMMLTECSQLDAELIMYEMRKEHPECFKSAAKLH